MTDLTKGVLMIAHNNPEIDYGQMALINGLLVKANLKVPICLVSDDGTINWLKQVHGEQLVNQVFDVIRSIPVDTTPNFRTYKDSTHMNKKLQYNNGSRASVYELSPFDQTLLLDTDYLVLSDALNKVWDSPNELMMNKQIDSFSAHDYFFDTDRLSKTGIDQYWATVVYFRKSELAETFFDLCQHVKQNYEFYKFTYGFSGSTYRNDYVYSIALHMLNGFTQTDRFDLPNPVLLFTADLDVLHELLGLNELLFLVEIPKEHGNYYAVNCKGVDVHVMNKYSINRHVDKFKQIYGGLIE